MVIFDNSMKNFLVDFKPTEFQMFSLQNFKYGLYELLLYLMKVNAKKVLSLNNISKSYQNNLVINNFSVDFNYGNSVGIIGKNGSGKSTILKISCGLLKPDSGNVLLMGKSFDSTEESLLIKSRMGVVLHEDMLYPQLTVFENLNFYSKILGIKNVNNKIEELSTLLNLSDYLKISVSKLSNGNKKRVSFAKSLLNDPDILFADEPESNLDDNGKEIVSKIFNDRRKRGLTNFFSTHSEIFLEKCSNHLINLNILNFVINEKLKFKDFSETLKRILKSKTHQFPFDGKYLIKNGMQQGSLMGIVLKEIEEEWIKNNFKISKERVREIIVLRSN